MTKRAGIAAGPPSPRTLNKPTESADRRSWQPCNASSSTRQRCNVESKFSPCLQNHLRNQRRDQLRHQLRNFLRYRLKIRQKSRLKSRLKSRPKRYPRGRLRGRLISQPPQINLDLRSSPRPELRGQCPPNPRKAWSTRWIAPATIPSRNRS